MSGISERIALQEPRLAEDIAAAREERFTGLVSRQARFVFRVAYAVLRNVQDADDVVQDVFFKIYRSRAWERIEDERAFLARTAWRTAVDRLRKTQPPGALQAEAPAAGPDPEQVAMASNWDAVVRRLIDALPEELRQPLALSGFEELSSRDIAQIMGIPEGTVRTRLMRARQILKQKLKAMGAGL